MERLILVDGNDNGIGYNEKEDCHLIPMNLHRAFSIFIIDSKSHMLIHKRQTNKKTWPGFWTNACCSHPREGEIIEDAARRRLQEELGFTCDVQYLFRFQYEAHYDERYGESEIDHVFFGAYDGDVQPNKDEIAEYKFVPIDQLVKDLKEHEEKYTPWFKKGLPNVLEYLQNSKLLKLSTSQCNHHA